MFILLFGYALCNGFVVMFMFMYLYDVKYRNENIKFHKTS